MLAVIKRIIGKKNLSFEARTHIIGFDTLFGYEGNTNSLAV